MFIINNGFMFLTIILIFVWVSLYFKLVLLHFTHRKWVKDCRSDVKLHNHSLIGFYRMIYIFESAVSYLLTMRCVFCLPGAEFLPGAGVSALWTDGEIAGRPTGVVPEVCCRGGFWDDDDTSCDVLCTRLGRKEMFYLTMHSTHCIYGYMEREREKCFI